MEKEEEQKSKEKKRRRRGKIRKRRSGWKEDGSKTEFFTSFLFVRRSEKNHSTKC
jgi:hypothetical protein